MVSRFILEDKEGWENHIEVSVSFTDNFVFVEFREIDTQNVVEQTIFPMCQVIRICIDEISILLEIINGDKYELETPVIRYLHSPANKF